MKLATMHKVDRWVGVLTTFLLTVALKLTGFLRTEGKIPDSVRNILFIELSEMGSVILLTPLIERVKKRYPEARIYFLTFSYVAPAVALTQQVDEDKIFTLRITSPLDFLTDFFRVLFRLRTVRFDITFDLELFSRISSLLSIFSRAPVRVGFSNFLAEGLYRGRFMTHPVTYNPHLHITKNFLGMFYALEEPWGDIPHTKRRITDDEVVLPDIPFRQETVDAFRAKLHAGFPQLEHAGKLVILNPNSSPVMPLRRWPLDSYLGLARKLTEDQDISILITGTAEEQSDAAYICDQLPGVKAIDLTGFTTLSELVALYHLCDLLVSNDSGPAHFSAVAGIPAIIIFGPETPDLYGSLNPRSRHVYKHLQCSPCSTAYNQRRSPCQNNLCVKLIEVDEIYGQAVEMLREGRA